MDNVDESDISLYRNITKPGDRHVMFELAEIDLRAYNFHDGLPDTTGLYCNPTNIPAIEDVDGDGDIDFMTLQDGGSGITLFLNNTVETGRPLDPPDFEENDRCWGDFKEYLGSNRIDFERDSNCNGHKYYRHLKKKHAGGSSLLLLDNDEDGDMDLILGNAGLDNLNLLINGKSDFNMKLDTMISNDSMFPSNTLQAKLKTYPAAYYVDVDGDLVKDMVVAVNSVDRPSYIYNQRGSVWYYKNKGKDNHPNFDFQDSLFITGEMADHGGHTAPLLWDMDKDGDLDIIVATNGDYGVTQDSTDYLNLYENVGSKTNPVFKLAVVNYLGLKKDSFQNLAPCLGDLDRDGDMELLVGELSGRLSLYEIVGAGKTATSVKTTDHAYAIQVYESSAPFLFDVDGDDYLDLLVGSYGGETAYYRNTSKTNVPNFQLKQDTFGGGIPGIHRQILEYNPETDEIDTSIVFYAYGLSSPVLADLDMNGDPEFVVGDHLGNITVYRNIRKSNLDSFKVVDEEPFYNSYLGKCYSYNFGENARPAIGDINGDGEMDMVIGTERGGFQIALGGAGSCNLDVHENRLVSKPLILYPNPTDGVVRFEAIQGEGKVTVTALSGQRVWEETIHSSGSIDLSQLDEGIYIVQLITENEQRTGKLIKLTR